MHANVQWRHNPATGEEAPYYRLKESYRDVCGTVHSLVVLNIGFEPALVPRQMRRIAAALTSRFAHRHQKDAFGSPLEGLDPVERDYAKRYWRQMITDGQIDRFDNRGEQARQEAGKYIDLDTVRHTDAREVGAEWLCKQAIDQLRMEEFLRGKGGTKNYEKVIERVGRAREEYPSVAKFYDIEYQGDEKKKENMGEVSWTIQDLSEAESSHGVYFLRTNVRTFDEKTTWDYYNLIREIECTNRQLKTDLNLRPIYHQRDDRSDAHLFLGMLAYWVVNTIRHQLKGKGENAYWTEIVRRMSTQKLVTTTAFNALGEKVELRQCSEPSKQAQEIYRKLGYKEAPFRKMKICRSQRPPD